MLDQEELLPEEQANPGLIRELRTIYRLKPAEQQVLSRVHRHLAEDSRPLPLSESMQERGHMRLSQPVLSAPTPSPSAWVRQRWMRPLNALAAMLLMGLLVGALVFVFSVNRSGIGSSAANGIHVFLVPAKPGSAPSHAALEATSALLSARFSSFGLHGFRVQITTSNGETGLLVDLPHFGGNEQQTIDILVGTGELAFWSTGHTLVPGGTVFDPSQYTQYNRFDRPSFTGQDLDPNSLAVSKDQAGRPQIQGSMKGEAVRGFLAYTASSIGQYLTITLDGKVLESALIERAIAGPFTIDGNFTQQQANALVATLKHSPLPIALKQLT